MKYLVQGRSFIRFLYVLLIVMLLSVASCYAADQSEYFAADELYVLGLFSGIGTVH